MLVVPASTSSSNLGFLSVVQEGNGYAGGYLVTNSWGRPLEFRLSSAVQPNKIQQILYGETLEAFLCGELIGKTLFDKTSTPVQCVITDRAAALELRTKLDLPVALLGPGGPPTAGLIVQPNLHCHTRFPDDVAALRQILDDIGPLDLAEPFLRIREAMVEAKKMGVTARAA